MGTGKIETDIQNEPGDAFSVKTCRKTTCGKTSKMRQRGMDTLTAGKQNQVNDFNSYAGRPVCTNNRHDDEPLMINVYE